MDVLFVKKLVKNYPQPKYIKQKCVSEHIRTYLEFIEQAYIQIIYIILSHKNII